MSVTCNRVRVCNEIYVKYAKFMSSIRECTLAAMEMSTRYRCLKIEDRMSRCVICVSVLSRSPVNRCFVPGSDLESWNYVLFFDGEFV